MKKSLLVFLAMISPAVVVLFMASAVFAADSPAVPASVPAETKVPAGDVKAPDGKPAVDVDYRIAEEDVLRLDVWGEEALSGMQMQVTPGGKINVPYLGEMQASGLTQQELTDNIVKALEKNEIIADAKVQITLIQIHRPTVRVYGAVNRPGEVEFKDGDKILDALAGAGSYQADNAWLEQCTVTHKDSDKPITIDIKKMIAGDLTQNFQLQKGDTIYIPPADYRNKFYVLGQVYRPGIYDLKDKTSVLSAVSLAGGPTERGVLRSTVVVRGDPAKPERVPCDLTKLFDKADLKQDIILQPGDVVIVPESKRPDWGKISQILGSLTSISAIRRYGLF
ncbi:MAG: polysaccharide biosynthesis/export family protein [Armatimonadota bacterium]